MRSGKTVTQDERAKRSRLWRRLGDEAGFTYVAALVMVVISGIMLSQGSIYWVTAMQKEREEELLFRGTQVRDALRRWYKIEKPVASQWSGLTPPLLPPSPRDLKELLSSSTTAAKTRYLRPTSLMAINPVTGKQQPWEIYRDPATDKIAGVYLRSDATPIKQTNFSPSLPPDDFRSKQRYSEWVFICDHFPSLTPGL